MPVGHIRIIMCAVEFRRGILTTFCGVEIGGDEIEPDEIVTCPLCIAEQERRWLEIES